MATRPRDPWGPPFTAGDVVCIYTDPWTCTGLEGGAMLLVHHHTESPLQYWWVGFLDDYEEKYLRAIRHFGESKPE